MVRPLIARLFNRLLLSHTSRASAQGSGQKKTLLYYPDLEGRVNGDGDKKAEERGDGREVLSRGKN